MNPTEKTLLTTAFEALGPERLTRGLKAAGHTWNDCFLALAISGEPDALGRELVKHWRKQHFVSTLLGVRLQVVNEVVKAWDHEEGAFRALAAEWLELNRAAAATAAAAEPLRRRHPFEHRIGRSHQMAAHDDRTTFHVID